MAHRGRQKPREAIESAGASNQCGKVAHATRKTARRAARRTTTEQLRAYRCKVCGWFHVGHLSKAVRRGDFTAREIYGQPA